ncbi:hypothetical protein AHAS_Ahas19G0278300 [Arachis hypogaea]
MHVAYEARMQGMFLTYHQSRTKDSLIELGIAPAVVVDGEFVVEWSLTLERLLLRQLKSIPSKEASITRVSLIKRQYCWVIRRYNGSHTCTQSTISQDHAKLDSDTIAEAIKPLVEAGPSIKVKSVINEVQSKFNYTISYCKLWLQKNHHQLLSMKPHMATESSQEIRLSVEQLQSNHEFRSCKPLVQVDGTQLYGKYQWAILVVVSQDENGNIVPLAFFLVEGETADA